MSAGITTRRDTYEAVAPVQLERRSVHRLPLVALTLLSLATLALRLARLDHQSLWLDEGYTLLFSTMTLPRLIVVGGAHEHPPLYYLLVHLALDLHRSYLVP